MKKSILISEELHENMKYYSLQKKMSIIKIAETAIERFMDETFDDKPKIPEFKINNVALETIIDKIAKEKNINRNELIAELLFEKVTEIYNQSKK